MQFEWDDAKAAANLREHGVSFAFATRAFEDPLALEKIDDREDYGEERIILIGHGIGEGSQRLLTIAYTQRDEVRRLISARTATKYEQDKYYRENAV
jgi:uncharacterized DUF497 family protein